MSIIASIDAVASALSHADPTDLRGLAALADLLADVATQAEAEDAPAVGSASRAAIELVERIILREVDDANEALKELRSLVGAMRRPEALPAPWAAPDDEPLKLEHADGDATLAEFIDEALEHVTSAEQAALILERDANDAEQLNTLFRAFHTIKGVAGFLRLGPVVELAHAAEALFDRARSGEVALDRPCLDLILAACDMLRLLVAQLAGAEPVRRRDHQTLVRGLRTAVERGAAPRGGHWQTTSAAQSTNLESAVKVSAAQLDGLLDLVGELVIAQLMVTEDPAVASSDCQRLQHNVAQLSRVVRDLQGTALGLRMIPLKSTFQRLTRLVRDLCAQSGKRIDLVLNGEDTQLDRAIVEELADPLVHMVRNACDHGIEAPDARVAAGKSPIGTLLLRAWHHGGRISVEITDDGHGLARERILEICRQRGLIAPDRRSADISDAEAWNFIFLPGFTTVDEVTEISGRGVGMDVVKRNIEALHGTIDIRSTPGQGTTFLIELPLTTAIIDGMVVRVGGDRYVLPTLSINSPFKPQPSQVHTMFGRRELVTVRDETLPVMRLGELLGKDRGNSNLCDGLVVVVESAGVRRCLAIDEMLGQQQVVIKPLAMGDVRWRPRGVSGGAILGDGRVALILDVNALMQETEEPPCTA